MTDRGTRILAGCFIVAVMLIIFEEVHDEKVMPRPRRFVGVGIGYGLLGIVSAFVSAELAAVFGVGILLALTYRHWANGSTASGGSVEGGGGVQGGTPNPGSGSGGQSGGSSDGSGPQIVPPSGGIPGLPDWLNKFLGGLGPL